MTPETALQKIQESLAQGSDPLAVIDGQMPRHLTEAMTWARWRPLWDEYRNHYPAQLLGIAGVISRRAMREFDLEYDSEGRVRRKRGEGQPWKTPPPTLTFTLTIQEQPVTVKYTQGYFPSGGDYFAFIGPGDPPQPHPLSETGYWSQFVAPETVEACGGPEAFARQYAEATLRGEQKHFMAGFEGKPLEMASRKRQAQEAPQQRSLF